MFHERTKHVHEAFDDKLITLPHVTIDLQVANIFTEALPRVKHLFFVWKIYVINVRNMGPTIV